MSNDRLAEDDIRRLEQLTNAARPAPQPEVLTVTTTATRSIF